MAEGRSCFFYAGVGCLVALLVGVTCVGGCVFLVGHWFRGIERTMRDERSRTAKALEILGADELPEGYRAVAAIEVPFLLKVAVLSNGAPSGENGTPEMGDRGLIYLDLIRMGGNRRELRDYFEGRTDDPGVLRRNHIDVDVRQIIRRGVVRAGEAELLYVAQRGTVTTQHAKAEGLLAISLVECPNDRRGRIAIWYGPDPSPGTPPAQADFSGTPADERALAAFMGRFRFCGAPAR